jgi:flagellar basal-body rod modification protein FlgD
MTSPVGSTAAVGTINPNTAPPDAAAAKANAGSTSALLDPQAFLQLLVAQLQYQDPTNPVDTSSFMNQTAMLSQVQSMTTMTSTLTSLAGAQQTQAATSMIGKQVAYTDSSGMPRSGVVASVSITGGVPSLHVGSDSIALSDVRQVSDPPAAG